MSSMYYSCYDDFTDQAAAYCLCLCMSVCSARNFCISFCARLWWWSCTGIGRGTCVETYQEVIVCSGVAKMWIVGAFSLFLPFLFPFCPLSFFLTFLSFLSSFCPLLFPPFLSSFLPFLFLLSLFSHLRKRLLKSTIQYNTVQYSAEFALRN